MKTKYPSDLLLIITTNIFIIKHKGTTHRSIVDVFSSHSQMVSCYKVLAFAVFLAWMITNWGMATTGFTCISLLFSQYTTVFGRNLFWVVSAFYIPFITALFWFHSDQSKSKHPLLYTFIRMFSAACIKPLFADKDTNHQFITSL